MVASCHRGWTSHTWKFCDKWEDAKLVERRKSQQGGETRTKRILPGAPPRSYSPHGRGVKEDKNEEKVASTSSYSYLGGAAQLSPSTPYSRRSTQTHTHTDKEVNFLSAACFQAVFGASRCCHYCTLPHPSVPRPHLDYVLFLLSIGSSPASPTSDCRLKLTRCLYVGTLHSSA